MGEFSRQIDIDAPPTEVFGYIADGSRAAEWYEAVRGSEQVGTGAPAEGSRYRFERELPQGRVVNEVEITEFEEPRVVAFTSRSGPTPFSYRYLVEGRGSGSTVTLQGRITGEGLRGPSAILAPLAAKFFERGMAANLQRLKQRLES